MGEETSEIRSKDTVELLDYGYNNYKLKTIFKNNIKLGKVKANNSEISDIETEALLNDVKTKTNSGKTANNRKGISIGYTEKEDVY